MTQLPDGTFTLHVPEVILFTPTPGTALVPSGFGPTTAPPSFCQPTLAVQDPLTSRYSAFFTDVSFNGSTYNASIQQQAAVNWSTLAVPQSTQMCTVYSISSFGTYTGTQNLKSSGGTGSASWSIAAGAVGSVSGPNPASCQ